MSFCRGSSGVERGPEKAGVGSSILPLGTRMFIDTHSHLNFPDFSEDYKEVIARAKKTGISAIINVGADLPTSKRAIELAQKEDLCYAAVGIHPTNTSNLKDEDYQELEDLAQKKKVVAIGEIGLDYFHNSTPKEIQKESFKRQILLAKKLNLPVIIHNRDANEDILAILKKTKQSNFCYPSTASSATPNKNGVARLVSHRKVKKGVMHCFSGDINLAKKVLSLGIHISFTGNLTYKKNDGLRVVAKEIPLKKLLLETDCPYLPPQPKRGKRNEPGFLIYTAEELAKIKGISLEELGEITTKNAKELFGI